MNALVLFTLLCAAPPQDPIIDPPPNLIEAPPVKVVPRASYKFDDFHVYDESLKLHGLPLVQKLFVLLPSEEEKRLFLLFGKKLPNMVEFATVAIGINKELKGYVLLFEDRASTLKALNDCLKEGYNVYPVVIYDDIEMAVPNEILVTVHSSIRKSDYLKRLNKVAEGKFELHEIEPKTFSLSVKDLINPSNILVLSNLIAQDSFWVKYAMPAFIPLNGYVWARATIETPSFTHLGQERVLKIDIDVFDPKINVKLDLLPQMGPTFAPFPNAGDDWIDIKPPVIKETKTSKKRTISVEYPFRYLQHGNFVFQPISVPYEKNGRIMQAKTNVCRYVTKSVIMGAQIEDLQPESYSSNLVQTPVTSPVKSTDDYLDDVKMVVPAVLAGTGAILLLFWVAGLVPVLAGMLSSDPKEALWEDLDACLDLDFDNWVADYNLVSSRLNKVLVQYFNVSLHALSPELCNNNFGKLLGELNKLYMQHVEADSEVLIHALTKFCYERKYD
jgi:hypothetical protein